MKPDTRIDDYIAKAQPFAQPILSHLRMLVHKACPKVEEKMKWSMPHFDYLGEMMCSMASFKRHAVFGFWKYQLIKDSKGYLGERSAQGGEAMGNLGRITDLNQLPPDKAILDFVKQAMKLNEQGVKVVHRKPPGLKKEIPMPRDFEIALKRNKSAWEAFQKFPPSHKREYLEWIVEAKREETRKRRIEVSIQNLAAAKGRNWKYERK